MDGVRGYYSGSQLLSRQGKELRVPSNFTEGFPRIQLDGELWMGRGTYEILMGLLNAEGNLDKWNQVGYYIFDLPSSSVPYEARLEELRRIAFPPHVHIVNITECLGKDHLISCLDEVVAAGGEGLMLRDPIAPYIPGIASASILKVKVLNLFLSVNY